MRLRTLLAVVAACAAACSSSSNTKPAMSQDEMTKRMIELGTPGPNHRRLDPMVGTFKTTMHMATQPGSPDQVSEGTTTNEWVLGGRFVQQKLDGTMMGGPFQGIGFTGYDNATGKYQGTWIDSFGTFIMPVATGTVDTSGKVITFTRTFADPIMDETYTTREVVTIQDQNHHSFEWFKTGPDGKETRMFRVDYVRK